jgi:hypothetical protein
VGIFVQTHKEIQYRGERETAHRSRLFRLNGSIFICDGNLGAHPNQTRMHIVVPWVEPRLRFQNRSHVTRRYDIPPNLEYGRVVRRVIRANRFGQHALLRAHLHAPALDGDHLARLPRLGEEVRPRLHDLDALSKGGGPKVSLLDGGADGVSQR